MPLPREGIGDQVEYGDSSPLEWDVVILDTGRQEVGIKDILRSLRDDAAVLQRLFYPHQIVVPVSCKCETEI